MKNKFFKNADVLRQLTLLIFLAVAVLFFSSATSTFFTHGNMINIFRQVAVTAISSVGMFMVILLGDIDLSVGSVYGFIGVLLAYVFRATESSTATLFAALAMGGCIGLVSGTITAKSKIPAFITTLSVMSICRGIAFILTRGTPIGVTNPGFTVWGSGYLFGMIPIPVVIMALILLIGFFLTGYTRFGRHIYAVGGNAQASLWSGLKTDRIRISVFVISGMMYGLSALVLAGRLGGGLPAAGEGAELDVITTVILGGTSLSGGKGQLWGVIIAALLIGVLNNGLTMVGVSTYWQQVLKGVIILVAVIMDTRATSRGDGFSK